MFFFEPDDIFNPDTNKYDYYDGPEEFSPYSLKNDNWIVKMSKNTNPANTDFVPLIEPFTDRKVSKKPLVPINTDPAQSKYTYRIVSYGLSSFGYDLTLSEKSFQIFRHIPGHIMDPHRLEPACLAPACLSTDLETGARFFVLPAHSYALGVVKERIVMPKDVLGICIGKSTYARLGIICNMTPVEPGWAGHLTLELSNSSGADCKIYVDEGICQIIFYKGVEPYKDYGNGKYQNQKHEVTHARV